jgi:hypothetical protein
MADMTDEEYEALDEYVTTHELTLGPNGTGWLSQREMKHWGLFPETVDYLVKKAMETRKPPAQLINEMVAKEIAAAEPVAV